MAFVEPWNGGEGHPFNGTFRGYPVQQEAGSVAAPHLLSKAVIAENVLHERGFPRLHVRAYGQHLVIYTQEDDERWNPTPFTGTLTGLRTMLVNDFAFVLTPT